MQYDIDHILEISAIECQEFDHDQILLKIDIDQLLESTKELA
ncbi:hypothetical protein ACLM5H_20620 [Fredinandcohnia humi]